MPEEVPNSSTPPAMDILKRLTLSQRDGLRDFWLVYRTMSAGIYEQVARAFVRNPDMAAFMESLPTEELKRQREASAQLLERALSQGEWDPYLQDLHRQGATLAENAVPYSAWYPVYGAFREVMLAALQGAYSDNQARLLSSVQAMDTLTDVVMLVIGQSYIDSKEAIIERQQAAIRELSIPMLQVRKGLFVVPLVGALEPPRARQLTEQVLATIRRARARVIIFDVTGVAIMDTRVANDLLQTAAAAKLLGATAIITGISPQVAVTMVSLGVDLSRVITLGDLEGGLEEAAQMLDVHGDGTRKEEGVPDKPEAVGSPAPTPSGHPPAKGP